MQAEALRAATEEQYLQAERQSPSKHEWRRGKVVAMAGASPRHNVIAGNVFSALKVALRGRKCLTFPSDQRIHILATGTYTYPDVAVTCEKPTFHEKDQDALTNPKMIVEVLSKSTEAYDRGAKFADYQSIPSLMEYVIVSQTERRVEHFRRLESGQWLLTVAEADGKLSLPSLDCEIPLAEIYVDLELLGETHESPPPPSAITIV